MELRHLRYFLAVSETLNFSAAARRLGISQPPLSMQIRTLEDELNTKLFTRNSRMVRLTEAGIVFLKDARRVVEQADAAKSRLADALAGRLGVLRLGFSPDALHGKVLRKLRKFLRRHPTLQLEPVFDSNTAVHQRVLSGELDGGIVHGSLDFPTLHSLSLQADSIRIALPKKHALLTHKQLAVRDLDGDTLLVGDGASRTPFETLLLGCLAGSGIRTTVRPLGNSTMERLWATALGLGLSICSSAVADTIPFDLPLRPLEGDGITIDIRLIWSEQSSALSLPALIEHLSRRESKSVQPEPA